MSAVKERIIGAVTVMSDSDAENFWKIIQKKFTPSWDNIEEIEPDEDDIAILQAIEEDPECHKFTKESDIDWNN